MRRIAIAAFGVGVALGALAHCGGTTGSDSPTSPVFGETDVTVGADGAAADLADASSDQSVYTNRFDVDIQYADQGLPDIQAPADGGVVQTGPSVPDCPPFIYVDGKGDPLPPGTCDPSGGCSEQAGAVPADWSDGGEVIAPAGSICATYPWLGSLGTDNLVTSNNFEDFNELPPCNWALEAGVATQGPMVGTPRYDLCIQLYSCFMQTRCFLNKTSSGTYADNPFPCFCQRDVALHPGTTFSATACIADKGPCYDYEAAALEAPVDPNNPEATAAYVQMHFNFAQAGSGAAGVEGSTLNRMFIDAIPYFPSCAVDAGFDCGGP